MAKGWLFPGSRPFSVGAKPVTHGATLSRYAISGSFFTWRWLTWQPFCLSPHAVTLWESSHWVIEPSGHRAIEPSGNRKAKCRFFVAVLRNDNAFPIAPPVRRLESLCHKERSVQTVGVDLGKQGLVADAEAFGSFRFIPLAVTKGRFDLRAFRGLGSLRGDVRQRRSRARADAPRPSAPP